MYAESSIKALVTLIDDPDENVYVHVRDQLKSIGSNAIPYLEQSWENENGTLLLQSRIENLIQEIQFDNIKMQMSSWAKSVDKDLLEGAIIVAKYNYPQLDETIITQSIQKIRKDIWLEINPNMTAFENIKVFNKIFFGTYNFQGDTKNFHSPLNSCINTVMEFKKGNPLSLSLIYSIIAQSLDLPVYGVNLPNHFILAYLDENNSQLLIENNNKYGVLFYINPFSKGSLLDTNAVCDFLDGMQIPHYREFFEPCPNSAIIRRMITNLIASFQQVGNVKKVEELTEIRDLID
jgi:regulator of sirC expression with transglutaminase-like and TPR domain